MKKKDEDQECREAKQWIRTHSTRGEKEVNEMTCTSARLVAGIYGWKSQDELARDAKWARERAEEDAKRARQRAEEDAKWQRQRDEIKAKRKSEDEKQEAKRQQALAEQQRETDTYGADPPHQAERPSPQPVPKTPKVTPKVTPPANDVVEKAEEIDRTLDSGVLPRPIKPKSDREEELDRQIRQKARELLQRPTSSSGGSPPSTAPPSAPDAARHESPTPPKEDALPPLQLDGLDHLISEADARQRRQDDQRQALAERKIADNTAIQRSRDPESPPSVEFSGLTSQQVLQQVAAGKVRPGDFLVFRPVGAMEGQLPIKVMREVTIAQDRSVMYVQEDIVYRVVNESGYHAYRRVTPFPIAENQRRGYTDQEFVARQTVFIRTAEARAFHPTQGLNEGDGATETAPGKLAEASKLGLDSLDGLAGDKYSEGKWLNPWSNRWEAFPPSLTAAGYEPGPGTLRSKEGINVYLGTSLVPGSWWGDDWAKKQR